MNSFKKSLISILVVINLFFIVIPIKTYANNTIPSITISNDGKVSNGLSTTKKSTLLTKVLKQYRKIIVFISGVGLLSMVMFFIFNLIELGNSRGNPQLRQKAINGLIMSGIATAGLGSVTLITTLFYNMLTL